MKKLFSMIALLGVLGMGGPVMAEDAAPLADQPAVTAPASEAAPAAPAAEAVTPAAVPEVAPVPEAKLDSGNTAWMLTATALVLFMTIPGLALFYGGMVRKKNVLSIMMQSFAIAALMSVIWMVAGYSLAFTPGSGFIGGLDKMFLNGVGLDSLTGVAGANIPE
ncbi:MAG: ammonia channel protein, partial [Sulfurimicrobium sp.]|nr:ammonia channel protein [Sulfurimicrobium sp.]